MLEVRHVTKTYTAHTALDDVSFTVPSGTVYGLLGPNGAGKTSLIRIINRITAPDSGQLLLEGRPMTDDDVRLIGYLPEERGLYKKMKVGEQAVYFARLRGMSRTDAVTRLKGWFDRFGIRDWWGRKVEELSKGMAQKVQFIVTVLHEPRLLIFDEPFSGFDPINANLLKEEILRLKENGATVIFSTHNMSSVEEICDHITLIHRSKNILSGSIEEIRHRFGEDAWRLDYCGDPELLERSLEGMPVRIWERESTPMLHSLRIEMNGVPDREVFGKINGAVEIRNLVRVVPTMNDIFIKAVEGSLPPAGNPAVYG